MNLLKFFSELYNPPINKKIVCFSSPMGKAFRDNPKYLFLYLKSNSTYQCYWFTSSRDLYDRLRDKGYQVMYSYSFKAIRILRSAGYIFTARSLNSDYLPISFSKETIKINTWHGYKFKKLRSKKAYKKLLIKKNYYIISPSSNVDKFLIEQFKLDSSKIITTGLPRNDILFQSSENFKHKIKKKYNIPNKTKRIILYAPTFRRQHRIAKIPLSNVEFKELDNFLKETNTIFIFKPHIWNEYELLNYSDNIIVVDKYTDTQELMIISDLLITDYSSIFFDFILMLKPIILFPYDFDEYIKNQSLIHKLEDIKVGPIVKTGRELIKSLKTISNWLPGSLKKCIEIRNKYWDYYDGKSCERVFNRFFLKNNNSKN